MMSRAITLLNIPSRITSTNHDLNKSCLLNYSQSSKIISILFKKEERVSFSAHEEFRFVLRPRHQRFQIGIQQNLVGMMSRPITLLNIPSRITSTNHDLNKSYLLNYSESSKINATNLYYLKRRNAFRFLSTKRFASSFVDDTSVFRSVSSKI
jgi:hypothetical protein